MNSSSETGHAKNVANFKQIITTVDSFGTSYNPMAEALQVEGLKKQAEKADEVLIKLKEAETLAKQSTAMLQEAFATLNTLSSQLMGLLISSGAKASSIEEARAIQKRINGSNAKKAKTALPANTTAGAKEGRSTSRQSYDSRLDDFEKLVTVLQNIPEYRPNEEAFQVKALQAKIQTMRLAIQEADAKEVTRSQTMHERNNVLYTEETGIVAITFKIKEYVKAIFGGVKSTQYKSISSRSL